MTQTPQKQYEQELNSILSVPRRFGGLGNLAANQLAQQFQRIRRRVQSTSVASGKAVAINPTLPKQVLGASAVQTASKQQDRTFSLVSVSFTRDANDVNFAGVRIWFKGYKGNTQWQLVSSGTDSPVSFLEEATGETVQVAVQAVNQSGFAAPFAAAPVTTVTLSGVVSAPPAPTVSQTVTPVVGGFQFTFALEAGLLADVVDSYKVYRNTVNVSGSASVCQTIKHPQSNNGSYVVQDYPGGDSVYFYWVSAVNTMGLESSLTAAQSSTQAALTTQNAFGKNLVANPGFESNLVATPALTAIATTYPVTDGWSVAQNDGAAFNIELDNAHSHSGANSGFISIKTSQSIPANTTYGGKIRNSAKLPLAVGDIIRVSGWINTANTGAPPAGLVLAFVFGIDIFSASGSFLGSLTFSTNNANTGGWVSQQNAVTIPATLSGSVPAYAQFFQGTTVQNTTGSPVSTGTNLIGDYRFDDARCVIQNTAYDLTPINTSGQPQTSVSPLSQSGATTINVAGTTWQFGDGTVSYNAGSVNPGALGTWYVYASDPTYSGGAVTYVATANAWGILASNGYVYFGVITTVGGGGATGVGGGTGGGGGGGKRSLS